MLHKLHRMSALFIVTFILFHLINHSFVLVGIQQHIDVMDALRAVYRNVVFEGVLFLCLVFQVCSGVYFVWKRRGQRIGFFEKAQAISGLYLAYFLINHVVAVLFGRVSAGLDTNIYYGIAGFHVSPFQFYFVPYYFLAVVAIFVHLAAAFNWLSRNNIADVYRERLAYSIIAMGVVISVTLMLGFSGVFYEITIPPEYRATFE